MLEVVSLLTIEKVASILTSRVGELVIATLRDGGSA
jgi:hypothetical protein